MFVDAHLATSASFFQHRTTLLFVSLQTYCDDNNFKVPSIWPYILEWKFHSLLKNGVHFVNILGE